MIHLTELEERLAAASGSALRDEMVQQLAGTELRLRRQMAASLPRAEFAVASALADAALAAQEILEQWPGLAPAPPAVLQFTPPPRSSP
jgi:hypothetical protein